MKELFHRFGVLFLTFVLVLSLPNIVYANSGNTHIAGELRVDLPIVNTSGDYKVSIAGNGPINSWDTSTSFTTAWLAVYLPVFFQVGTVVNSSGYHWFAETDTPQIQCLEGTTWSIPAPSSACIEDLNSTNYVSPGYYQDVEIVTYLDGYWYARFYERDGTPHDVARIPSTAQTVTRVSANFEEAWTANSDPYLPAVFSFRHPQYMVWNDGFKEWPISSNDHKSFIYPFPQGLGFCPTHYGAALLFGNDPRSWYAGSAIANYNMVCDATLFLFNFVPIVSK
jgi:hypothetical protein